MSWKMIPACQCEVHAETGTCQHSGLLVTRRRDGVIVITQSFSGGGLLSIPDEVRVQLADGSVVWAVVR